MENRTYKIEVRNSKSQLVDSYYLENLEVAILKLWEVHKKYSHFNSINLICKQK